MDGRKQEVKSSSEDPQVFDFDSSPEVVSGPQWQSDLKRNGSLHSPRALHENLPESAHGDWSDKTATYTHDNIDKEAGPTSTSKPEQRRICGVKRKTFIWLTVVAALICVIAAVLGGVLGTVLNRNNQDDDGTDEGDTSATDGPSLLVRDKTGLAMINPADTQTLYAYYMDAAGKILEGIYENGTWDQLHLPDQQAEITRNVTSAPPGTPLAAVSYTRDSVAYRQVFWLDSQGLLTTTNRSGSGDWSEAITVTGAEVMQALPATIGLAACVGTNDSGLNGIRLYYGSTDGYVQEIGLDFSNNTNSWSRMNGFGGSDAQSGIACTMTGNTAHVYFRSTTNSALQQWTKDYGGENTTTSGWSLGTASRSGNIFVMGGSVAAASDGQNTDYVFYHSAANETSYTFVVGQTMTEPSSDIESLQYSLVGYNLAATWAPNSDGDEGAVALDIYYADSDLYFTSVSRDGSAYEAVTETGR